MNQLATTPPSADTAGKNAAAVPSVPLKFRTVEELRNSALPSLGRGQIPPLTRIPVGEIVGAGVAESTLSERGAALAAQQGVASQELMNDVIGTLSGGLAAAIEAEANHPELPADIAADMDASMAKLPVEKPIVVGAGAMAKIDPKTGRIVEPSEDGVSPEVRHIQEQMNAAVRAVMDNAGKPKAKPARRPPMSMVKRLEVLDAIRKAPADKPDAELAASISLALGHAVGSGTVASYRSQLGLASVKMPSKAELRAKLAAAEQALAAAQQPTLPGVDIAAEANANAAA